MVNSHYLVSVLQPLPGFWWEAGMVTAQEKALVMKHVTTTKEKPSTKFWARCPSVGQELIFPGPQASVPDASPFTGIQP